jgi:hypothetical protein
VKFPEHLPRLVIPGQKKALYSIKPANTLKVPQIALNLFLIRIYASTIIATKCWLKPFIGNKEMFALHNFSAINISPRQKLRSLSIKF